MVSVIAAALVGIAISPRSGSAQPFITHVQTPSAVEILPAPAGPQGAGHWRQWTYINTYATALRSRADSTGLFSFGGGLEPRYFVNRQNAALDAAEYSYLDLVLSNGATVFGGARSPASSDRIAGLATDGRLDTYWEPAEAKFDIAGLRQWELDIDLGRLVVVDSIVVILPSGKLDEDAADPPKSLAILGSVAERSGASVATAALKYYLIGSTPSVDLEPAGDEGQYLRKSFPVTPVLPADFDEDGLPDFSGSYLHYIRLKVTDSDLDHKSFLGDDDDARRRWLGLSPERRGLKLYQRRTRDESLTAVDSLTYAGLDSIQQGPIRYFLAEVPRILEVQVWTQGDNVAYRPETRAGGAFELGGRGNADLATDGIYQTGWTGAVWHPTVNARVAWYDFGATFWVDRMYVGFLNAEEKLFKGNDFLISDGTIANPISMETVKDFEALEEGLQWTSIISEGQVDNNDTDVAMFREKFPMRPVRFVQAKHINTRSTLIQYFAGELAEMQFYGQGYPVSVTVESPQIRIQENNADVRRAMTRIFWEADALVRSEDPLTGEVSVSVEPLVNHPEVSLNIRTRTSDTENAVVTYYKEDARGTVTEVTEAEWNRLSGLSAALQRRQGKPLEPVSVTDLVGWSNWSAAYEPTGQSLDAVVTSPNPRKYIQFRVELATTDPNKAARLRTIRLELQPPLSLGMVGELAVLSPAGRGRPIDDLEPDSLDYLTPTSIRATEDQVFSYFLRAAGPDPVLGGNGIDEVKILPGQAAQLQGVRVGEVRMVEIPDPKDSTNTIVMPDTVGNATRFTDWFMWSDAGGQFVNQAGQPLVMLSPLGADSLHFRFPTSINADKTGLTHGLIEVRFGSNVYRQGKTFRSFVRDSFAPGDIVFQRVETANADATELVASGAAVAQLVHTDRLINDLRVSSHVTPNGDGVNDELDVRFVLLQVMEERPVEATIYDLAGRQVGTATTVDGSGRAILGQVGLTWNGRDTANKLVPPGIYSVVIEVGADTEEKAVRTFGVAY